MTAALVWRFPKDAMEPLVTTTLLLFGFAALQARFGPKERRTQAAWFAIVGVGVLAAVFGPWLSGPQTFTLAPLLCEPIAELLYSPGSPAELFTRKNEILPVVYLALVLGAWLLAVAAGQTARIISYARSNSLAFPASGGEPCPS
jgi:hypothetical protein